MARTALLVGVLTSALSAATGCAARATPYRFAGPMVSAVSLDDVAEHGRHRHRGHDDGGGRRGGATRIVEVPGAPGGVEIGRGGGAQGGRGGAIVRDELARLDPVSGEPAARKLEPHRQPRAASGTAVLDVAAATDAPALRALIGSRDGRDHVAFALAAATALGGAPDPALAAIPDGPALVGLARGRNALASPAERAAAPGDLLVFDRAIDDAPASLVAAVLERDGRGVLELIYLARGVVRRGFVDPTRPATKRDADGRIVNTFLRHGSNHPPKGTRYLAGELLAHVIAWRDL